MQTYALRIEYDGTPFHGWQRQESHVSVQGAIEAALAKLGEPDATVQGAGRTDAGVHATGQVAHVALQKPWSPFRLSEALNYHLRPAPVAILAAVEVGEEFHARFDAVERRYLYRILSRRAPLALERQRLWRMNYRLDTKAMRAAAAHLVGKHDFTTFRSSICQAKSPVKTLDEVSVTELETEYGWETQLRFRARSFLHNQVRSLTGTLERVGAGAWPPDQVASALAAKDRAACGPVCPPDGLYLTDVLYPSNPFAPASAH
ncbi:tRNA pseudouridine(38-40) synthase TruA [Algicella marina]|uniref:tRNA pseudouridine synthase A n=1 Tax=Algicella marina TaxID=2683284 RepID=A0A6P1SZI1_9RHOB|nr:tRNA pseudouridine(38-40) synthase TruA [Algicella marina]QHQ36094.1 tRNA pseudouridine(38-40) synthase TruA [Algicella marina]